MCFWNVEKPVEKFEKIKLCKMASGKVKEKLEDKYDICFNYTTVIVQSNSLLKIEKFHFVPNMVLY